MPITASWSTDLFGTLLSSKRSAQVALLQTKDYQVAVQTNLIANIANMYYSLLMLDKQLEIVNDMEGLTKNTWDIMKLQKNAVIGVRSTGVQRAESNYYSVLTQKADIQRQIRETENSLSLLLGQQVQSISRGKIDEQSLPSNFSTGVGVQLLNNRADVHSAEMKLAQCFYNIETARSRFYPALNINASGAFTNNSGMGIVNPGKLLLTAVGSLTQPIFQNGKLVAGLKVAQAEYQQAYNTWQNSILTAGSEVSNALVLYNSSAEKSKIEAKQVEVLKQNIEDTKALMASAGSTNLENLYITLEDDFEDQNNQLKQLLVDAQNQINSLDSLVVTATTLENNIANEKSLFEEIISVKEKIVILADNLESITDAIFSKESIERMDSQITKNQNDIALMQINQNKMDLQIDLNYAKTLSRLKILESLI
jgi:outer membrane protein TolC